jgi:hypothetical protein
LCHEAGVASGQRWQGAGGITLPGLQPEPPPSIIMHGVLAYLQALGDLRESGQGLPEQILAEVHFQIQPGQFEKDIPPVAAKNQAQMSLLFSHLANLGYGITSREDNGYQNLGCCSEFSFLRVETTTSLLYPEAQGLLAARWSGVEAKHVQGARLLRL